VIPYARRRSRDALLNLKSADHVSYYRGVMRSDTGRCPEAAVGSHNREEWLKIGRLQFDYLVRHGLQPGDRMLEIGCGNLRAGRLFIDYLGPGNYYGIDISPEILLAAQRTLAESGLQAKVPHLMLVNDLKFAFLPAQKFTVVHAHSVFSHSPLPVIDECLAHVGRIMTTDAIFDFTFDRTEGEEHQVLREDFYYRTGTLLELAARHGLDAQLMTDWEETGHPPVKDPGYPPRLIAGASGDRAGGRAGGPVAPPGQGGIQVQRGDHGPPLELGLPVFRRYPPHHLELDPARVLPVQGLGHPVVAGADQRAAGCQRPADLRQLGQRAHLPGQVVQPRVGCGAGRDRGPADPEQPQVVVVR